MGVNWTQIDGFCLFTVTVCPVVFLFFFLSTAAQQSERCLCRACWVILSFCFCSLRWRDAQNLGREGCSVPTGRPSAQDRNPQLWLVQIWSGTPPPSSCITLPFTEGLSVNESAHLQLYFKGNKFLYIYFCLFNNQSTNHFHFLIIA